MSRQADNLLKIDKQTGLGKTTGEIIINIKINSTKISNPLKDMTIIRNLAKSPHLPNPNYTSNSLLNLSFNFKIA